MKIERTSNAVSLRHNDNRSRVLLMRGQRSAGRHLLGPVFMDTEWHNFHGIKFFNLTVGNPKVHARWAFQLWIYFS